jgi:hypothetical protein
VYWESIPPLEQVAELLSPWGEVTFPRNNTLRHIPFDFQLPTCYVDARGLIDIFTPNSDLFYREDCLEALQKWIGEKVKVVGED